MSEPISPLAFRRTQAAAALLEQAAALVVAAAPDKPEDFLWLLDEVARILGEIEGQRPSEMPPELGPTWDRIDSQLPRLHAVIDACRDAASFVIDNGGES